MADDRRLPAASKKLLQQLGAFSSQDPATDLHAVVQAGMIQNLKHGMNRARFRVIRSVNQPLQASMHHRSCTHRARLNCNKELAVSQAMVTDVLTSLTQRDDLGVRGGIGVGEIAIPSSSDDLAFANH